MTFLLTESNVLGKVMFLHLSVSHSVERGKQRSAQSPLDASKYEIRNLRLQIPLFFLITTATTKMKLTFLCFSDSSGSLTSFYTSAREASFLVNVDVDVQVCKAFVTESFLDQSSHFFLT